MKITKTKLNRIIEEEIQNVLKEGVFGKLKATVTGVGRKVQNWMYEVEDLLSKFQQANVPRRITDPTFDWITGEIQKAKRLNQQGKQLQKDARGNIDKQLYTQFRDLLTMSEETPAWHHNLDDLISTYGDYDWEFFDDLGPAHQAGRVRQRAASAKERAEMDRIRNMSPEEKEEKRKQQAQDYEDRDIRQRFAAEQGEREGEKAPSWIKSLPKWGR